MPSAAKPQMLNAAVVIPTEKNGETIKPMSHAIPKMANAALLPVR